VDKTREGVGLREASGSGSEDKKKGGGTNRFNGMVLNFESEFCE